MNYEFAATLKQFVEGDFSVTAKHVAPLPLPEIPVYKFELPAVPTAPDLETRCVICDKENHVTPQPHHSHGLCLNHACSEFCNFGLIDDELALHYAVLCALASPDDVREHNRTFQMLGGEL